MKEKQKPVLIAYKDRVFRMLYKDKLRLLELYNGLNGTNYTNPDDLTVNTLENAIFLKMKNDVSFIIDCNMCLYEHQSTFCPNMPLRGFFYFADLYKRLLKDTDLSVNKLVTIPTPHYIVFYNGKKECDDVFTQRLSDAFEDDTEGCIEVTVRVINVNYGRNLELLQKCPSLYGYAYFVSSVRHNLEYMELEEAVSCAVDECIEKNILKDFLLEQKAEVVAMSIYEYNEEYVKRVTYEEGMEEGYAKGRSEGRAEGRSRLVNLIENAMKNLKMDLQETCDALGINIEEYWEAKNGK